MRSDHHGHDWQDPAFAWPEEQVGARDRAHHGAVAQHGGEVAARPGRWPAEVPARRAAEQAHRIPRRAQAGAEGRRSAAQARAPHGQGAVRRDQERRLRRWLHPRHRLHPGVAPGRRPGGVGQRLHTAGLRARRGLPVRLERGRPGGRRHLLPRAGLAHEAVRQPGVLARGLPEPGPRDAVRCPHPLVRGARRRGPARHLRQHEDGGRQGQEGQGPRRQRALRHHVRALPGRPRLLQRRQWLGEGCGREERAGQPPAHLDRCEQGEVRQLHRTQRLAGPIAAGPCGRRSATPSTSSSAWPRCSSTSGRT